MTLEDEYAKRCAEPSDIVDHLPRFVQMVVTRDAKHVVELGTRSGVSTIAWLYGLEQTGGRLTSVDLEPAPPIGDWPHWKHLVGDDLNPAVISSIAPADIVFIDTSHEFNHTLNELRSYRFVVKPGGLIVLHDTELEHPIGAPPLPAFPVRRAIERFCAEEGYGYTLVPGCWGLGIINA